MQVSCCVILHYICNTWGQLNKMFPPLQIDGPWGRFKQVWQQFYSSLHQKSAKDSTKFFWGQFMGVRNLDRGPGEAKGKCWFGASASSFWESVCQCARIGGYKGGCEGKGGWGWRWEEQLSGWMIKEELRKKERD